MRRAIQLCDGRSLVTYDGGASAGIARLTVIWHHGSPHTGVPLRAARLHGGRARDAARDVCEADLRRLKPERGPNGRVGGDRSAYRLSTCSANGFSTRTPSKVRPSWRSSVSRRSAPATRAASTIRASQSDSWCSSARREAVEDEGGFDEDDRPRAVGLDDLACFAMGHRELLLARRDDVDLLQDLRAERPGPVGPEPLDDLAAPSFAWRRLPDRGRRRERWCRRTSARQRRGRSRRSA